jgi:hypothetical protein
MLVLTAAPASPPASGPMPERISEQTIFEVKDGKIIAPLAIRAPARLPEKGPDEPVTGWTPLRSDDFVAYDAVSLFPREQGTLEVALTVLGKGSGNGPALGKDMDAIVTLYDEGGVPFFTIGMNDHDLTVGSFPLHPRIMEDVFGGTGFPYLAKLDGKLGKGTDVTIVVTWGKDPADNKVYVNGKLIERGVIKGPRTNGKGPGYQPTATLGSLLGGFSGVYDGRNRMTVTPAKTLVIGKMEGVEDCGRPMFPPRSVAIRKVRLSNYVKAPSAR